MARSARRRIACIAFSVGTVLPLGLAAAQDSPEQLLTGGSSRAWVAQRFAWPDGPRGACAAGEIYTFAATHELAVSRCRDGRVAQSRHRWSMSGMDGCCATLTIEGMGIFALRVPDLGAGRHRIRLQAVGSQPGMDVELSLDED